MSSWRSAYLVKHRDKFTFYLYRVVKQETHNYSLGSTLGEPEEGGELKFVKRSPIRKFDG
jgi:hypothetical protein